MSTAAMTQSGSARRLANLVATGIALLFAVSLQCSAHVIEGWTDQTELAIYRRRASNPYSKHRDGMGSDNTFAAKRVVRETIIVSLGTLWSDGNPRPNSVLLNGTSPGPLLRFRRGDVALVTVVNAMPNENTTIHFHGLSQALVPWADGTPMLSQWAIAPGNFFEYELHIGPEDYGTTFFHSHVGLQSTTAYAPLIIEDKLKSVPHDAKDRVMVLGDYFYQGNADMASGLLNAPFKWPGSAQSALLNGAALEQPCNATRAQLNQLDCAQSTYAGPAIVDVQYDRSYRLRWVGAQTLMHMAASIFNHTQSIVAVDGNPIVPLDVSLIELMGGQRCDSVLRSKSAVQVKQDNMHGCYPIRLESRWRMPRTNGWAILRYPNAKCNATSLLGAYNNTIAMLPPEQFGWISDQFHPIASIANSAPTDKQVSRRIVLQAQQVMTSITGTGGIRWDVNRAAFDDAAPMDGSMKPIDAPYLIQLYTNQSVAPSYERALLPSQQSASSTTAQLGFDSVSQTYVGRAGEVIEIVIINNGSATNNLTETHPWHFHGQDHYTVAMGTGEFTEAKFRAAKAKFDPPIARDTTGVWPGDGASSQVPVTLLPAQSSGAWSVIRYRVPKDSSATGVWMFHCHWGFHQLMGMATVWALFPQHDQASVFLKATTSQYKDPDYLYFGRNVSSLYTKQRGSKG